MGGSVGAVSSNAAGCKLRPWVGIQQVEYAIELQNPGQGVITQISLDARKVKCVYSQFFGHPNTQNEMGKYSGRLAG